MSKKACGVVVGAVGERVYAERSDVLDARAAGTVARHLGMTVDYEDGTGWVGTRPDGQRFLMETFYSLRGGEWKVDGNGFREGHPLTWGGQYRLTPLP